MVEQRIKKEPRFACRFEIIKNSYAALDPETLAFENDLQVIHDEFRQKSGFNSWWRNNYLIAASLALISLVSIGYFIWFKNPSPESLYLSYLEAPPNNITVRGEQFDQSLERAMEYYEQENYKSALEYLTEVLKARPDHQGALFYSGICHLMLGQYQSAQTLLQTFEVLDTSEYYTAAKWYLSLSLLKLNQVEEAESRLEQLAQLENGKYSRQAKELLDRMN